MANLYNKAGLVNIPIGYSDGFLYNIKPVDDTLAFRFNRDSAATRVNKEGLIETVAIDKPRIDYTDSLTSPSFLLEPQRTNLITYSEDFSEWTPTNATVIENTITSPDGTTTADKIVATSVTAQHRVNFTSSNATGATTFSFFAKAGEYSSCWARLGFTSSFFDLENGLTGGNSSGITSNIQYYGNGWYRCIMTKAASDANEVCRINVTTSYLVSGDFLGDNTSGIYLWGAQHEEGSYATSYIPTAGSTVTRAEETCNGAGNASTFNDSEGVLYFEGSFAQDGRISLSDGTTSNRITIRRDSSFNLIRVETISGGVFQGGLGASYTDSNTIIKLALKYKENDTDLYANGLLIGTDSTYTIPTNLNDLSFDGSNGSDNFYGKVKGIYVFNEALTDDELQQLTGPEYNSFAALAAAYNYTVI